MHKPVVTLERESPPAVNGAEENQTFVKMQGQMVIGDELVVEDVLQAAEVVEHVFVVGSGAVARHGASRSHVNSGDEVQEILQEHFVVGRSFW